MKKIRKFKKHVSAVYIKNDGEMHVFFEKLDNDSGQRIRWHEIIEEKIKIRNCQSSFDFTFDNLHFEYGQIKFLEYVRYFEIWPVTNLYALEEKHGKDFDTSLAKYTINAKLSDDADIYINLSNVNFKTIRKN
jgi:hypothetical protein